MIKNPVTGEFFCLGSKPIRPVYTSMRLAVLDALGMPVDPPWYNYQVVEDMAFDNLAWEELAIAVGDRLEYVTGLKHTHLEADLNFIHNLLGVRTDMTVHELATEIVAGIEASLERAATQRTIVFATREALSGIANASLWKNMQDGYPLRAAGLTVKKIQACRGRINRMLGIRLPVQKLNGQRPSDTLALFIASITRAAMAEKFGDA